MEVSWRLPACCYSVQSFVVVYSGAGSENTARVDADARSYTLVGLQGAARFSLRVRVEFEGGRVTQSEQTSFSTEDVSGNGTGSSVALIVGLCVGKELLSMYPVSLCMWTCTSSLFALLFPGIVVILLVIIIVVILLIRRKTNQRSNACSEELNTRDVHASVDVENIEIVENAQNTEDFKNTFEETLLPEVRTT